MVSPSSVLTSLPVRPPTPPRDRTETQSLSNEDFAVTSDRDLVSTPSHPQVDLETSQPSSSKKQKKVDFSPWNETHKLPINSRSSALKLNLRTLRPSREYKSSKSILKQSNYTPTPIAGSQNSSQHNASNFAIMLESIVQQLAGGSRSSKIDSYITLSGTLKAYDNVPDRMAMSNKMGLITQFLRRDICAKTETGDWDCGLIVRAMILLNIFVVTPEFAEMLESNFCSFVVDHSISMLEEQHASKQLVRHSLNFLSLQKFGRKIVTFERANRLIKALHTIESRISGNMIMVMRLVVYKRLLGQNQHLMISHIDEWLCHLLSGLLSSVNDIRCQAISFGTQAGVCLGTTVSVSHAVIKTLDLPDENEKTFFSFMCKELQKMTLSKENATFVPQVWSVIILFLRSQPHQLEKWKSLSQWLVLIQKCYNVSDNRTKRQADLAWNKFVLAIAPSSSTSNTFLTMLPRPIAARLKSECADEPRRHAHPGALCTYYNLLYYSFRPNASFEDLDVLWDRYVAGLIKDCLLSTNAGVDEALQIITALVWNPHPKVWNVDSAFAMTNLKREDLPLINCKWVRAHLRCVGDLFQKLLGKAQWSNSMPHIKLFWTALNKAISEAGFKEVKMSSDSLNGIADLLTLLKCIWKNGPMALGITEGPQGKSFVEAFSFFVFKSISVLGAHSFVDGLFLRNNSGDFQVVASPSKRPNAAKAPLSVLGHLLQFVTSSVDASTDSHRKFITKIIKTIVTATPSRATRVRLSLEFAQVADAKPNAESSVSDVATEALWLAASDCAIELLLSPPNEFRNAYSVTEEYKAVIQLLAVGLQFKGDAVFNEWKDLIAALDKLVLQEQGKNSNVLLLVEPLCEEIVKRETSSCIPRVCLIFKSLVFPESRQEFENAKAKLSSPIKWRTSKAEDRIFPFPHLLTLTNILLKDVYGNLESTLVSDTNELLTTLISLLETCPSNLASGYLRKIQDCIAYWIHDKDCKLQKEALASVKQRVEEICDTCITILRQLPKYTANKLRMFTPILVAGFSSSHQTIVEKFTTFWNVTFGVTGSLEYPDELEVILRDLQSVADIQLPGYPKPTQTTSSSLAVDKDSRGIKHADGLGSNVKGVTSTAGTEDVPSPCPVETQERDADAFIDSLDLDEHDTSSATYETETSTLGTPVFRLRNSDSQFQFANIDSSPLGPRLNVSQRSTERQRQNEEQTGTAAMFPDISSSPKKRLSTFDHQRSSSLDFGRSLISERSAVFDVPSSPILPLVRGGPMDDFIGSSPTPRSDSRVYDMNSDISDIPSSPPFADDSVADEPTEPVLDINANTSEDEMEQDVVEIIDDDNTLTPHAFQKPEEELNAVSQANEDIIMQDAPDSVLVDDGDTIEVPTPVPVLAPANDVVPDPATNSTFSTSQLASAAAMIDELTPFETTESPKIIGTEDDTEAISQAPIFTERDQLPSEIQSTPPASPNRQSQDARNGAEFSVNSKKMDKSQNQQGVSPNVRTKAPAESITSSPTHYSDTSTPTAAISFPHTEDITHVSDSFRSAATGSSPPEDEEHVSLQIASQLENEILLATSKSPDQSFTQETSTDPSSTVLVPATTPKQRPGKKRGRKRKRDVADYPRPNKILRRSARNVNQNPNRKRESPATNKSKPITPPTMPSVPKSSSIQTQWYLDIPNSTLGRKIVGGPTYSDQASPLALKSERNGKIQQRRPSSSLRHEVDNKESGSSFNVIETLRSVRDHLKYKRPGSGIGPAGWHQIQDLLREIGAMEPRRQA